MENSSRNTLIIIIIMRADNLSRAPGSEPAEQETLMEAETKF